MKAAQYNKYGELDVIEINANAPKPAVKPEQVLIEVHAASINPFDGSLRRGNLKDMIPLTFPVTIGGDLSGVISQSENPVFKSGDEVYGQSLIINGGSGSTAEFAVSNIKHLAIKPKNISHIEAASLVLVGVSAIQALEEHIKLQKDQRVFINGGSGGIGSAAIQLAKSIGAYVATTVSTPHVDFVKSLGADEVIDYKTQNFEEILKDFDAVFNTARGDNLDNLFKVVKSGGVIVSMVGAPNPELAKEHNITAIGQSTQITTERLNKLTELVEKQIIKPQINKIFSLDEAQEAYQYAETSHPQGKVVIEIRK